MIIFGRNFLPMKSLIQKKCYFSYKKLSSSVCFIQRNLNRSNKSYLHFHNFYSITNYPLFNLFKKNLTKMEKRQNICEDCKGPLLEDNTPDERKVITIKI